MDVIAEPDVPAEIRTVDAEPESPGLGFQHGVNLNLLQQQDDDRPRCRTSRNQLMPDPHFTAIFDTRSTQKPCWSSAQRFEAIQ